MLKIEKTKVYGWEEAIRGMRNPLNSWAKSDSYYTHMEDGMETANYEFFVGDADLDLMKRLRNSGTDHRKFMRMITVYLDITAPFYWWKEMDTYKVGTVANSCSTMHKLGEKPFTLDDFSHDHLGQAKRKIFEDIVDELNDSRTLYLQTKDKSYWWEMIQLLPTSYNQKRTVMLNYEVLANIYNARKSHKLTEWRVLCEWIENLPYAELITGKGAENE